MKSALNNRSIWVMSRVKSNPLSTRFVQPGRIAWHAVDSSQSLDVLVEYFTHQLNCRAAIVGPHGSGKSTLLAHLVPLLGTVIAKRATYNANEPHSSVLDPRLPHDIGHAVRSVVWLQMRGRVASARLLKETRSLWCQRNRLLVIDGFEQLSMFTRAMIVRTTWRHGAGLLVTSHRRTSLPTLVETKVDAQLTQQLLDRLLPADLPGRDCHLNADHLDQLLKHHRGNLREVFMQLYDEIE